MRDGLWLAWVGRVLPGFSRVPQARDHPRRLVIIGLILLAGCGATPHPPPRLGARPPSVCLPRASGIIAGFARVPAASTRSVAATGNDSQPECRFSAKGLRVVVNLDSSPQPYTRLERTIVEAGQQFGTVRSFAAPVAVGGTGLDAAWLPDQNQLITADQRRLISVRISWTGPHRPRLALARSLARLYLAS